MRPTRVPARLLACAVAFPSVLASAQQPSAMAATAEGEFTEARLAWEQGAFPEALRGFERLLSGASASAYLERIATITGEVYRTVEVTTHGDSVRLSPDGRWLTYERGAAPRVWSFVVPVGAPQRQDSVPGTSVAFDPAASRLAYVRPGQGEGDPWRLVLRDLASGEERTFSQAGLRVTAPVFTPDGRSLLFIAKADGAAGTHIWSLALGSMEATRLTSTEELRAGLTVAASGPTALWVVGRDPFATGRGGGGRGGPTEFATRDLESGVDRSFSGSAPSLSRDGRAVAYVQRRPGQNTIFVADLSAGRAPVAVKQSPNQLDAPMISPDGAMVAFQQMIREDWEIVLAGVDGSQERRLTREIQHDILPRWVTSSTLLGMIGEPRHRRSHLYDVNTGARTRLFHNNTIRTIAPEYAWVVAPDGSAVAIVADRDGDTVSPERGVYVVDLRTRVTREELLGRVRSQLRTELALREDARRRYGPVAAEIRPLTEQVSRDRIYANARELFLFDSKHITQPGNAKAIAYLDSVYTSYGYKTELQWFEPQPGRRSANVVATLTGTVSPDVVYVVGSHFDSNAAGPGADDNTSGTTMLLETARLLAAHPLPATVRFVSFTGEEAGLLGSREFVRRLKADSVNLVGAINNDMMGWANDQRLDNSIRATNPGIRDVQHGAALEFSRLVTYDARYHRSTDATAFYEGYGDITGGFGSYPILGNPHYHLSHDVLETINFELMVENTKANVATVMLLASAPARVGGLRAERAGARVALEWAPSPERDIREYVVRYLDASGVEQEVRSAQPRAALPSVRAGSTVMVRAVNRRGIEGWDWARLDVK